MPTFFSPAKINLFLKVIGKELDGYHSLSSVFQAIDLGDYLSFSKSHEDLFVCSDSRLEHQDNLVLKALVLFRKKTGIQQHFHIFLDKKIPIEAGLGGGSGNAATTLWALSALSHLDIDTVTLQQWGAELGADVPFFLSQGIAYCTGKGEKIQEIAPCFSSSVLVVKPEFGLSTAEVYKKFQAINSVDASMDLTAFLSKEDRRYFNDLEAAAFEVEPRLIELKKRLLLSGFDTVVLCGSGSAFFCLGKGQIFTGFEGFVQKVKPIYREAKSWYSSSLGE